MKTTMQGKAMRRGLYGLAAAGATLLVAGYALAVDVEAGPIMNQAQAQQRCPGVCQGRNMRWAGQWTTTVPGRMSVCGCEPQAAPAPAPTPAPAPAANTPNPTAWYRLRTQFRGQGECLEGNQSSSPTHNGAAFMDRCQNVSGQLWRFEPAAGGFYRLHTQFQGQDKCLEGNQASSPAHNGSAFLDNCQNVSGQLWRVVPEGNGFRLRTQFRGDGECLEGNQGSSPVHGGNAFMDRCQNVSGQLWQMTAN